MSDSMHEYQMRFAALLQRVPKDKRLQHAPVIAKQIVGKEQAERYPMHVINIATEWPHDPDVIAEIDRLDLIPIPKEVVLKDVYAIASDPYCEKKDKIAAFRLYSDMNGWTQKVSGKESGVPNEFLNQLEQLHNAVKNPVET